jgi:hypothetical protein
MPALEGLAALIPGGGCQNRYAGTPCLGFFMGLLCKASFARAPMKKASLWEALYVLRREWGSNLCLLHFYIIDIISIANA